MRRHGAREREHGRTRDDGARDPDGECHGIARRTPRARRPPPGRSARRRAASPPSPRSRGRARSVAQTSARYDWRPSIHAACPLPSARAAKPTSHGCVVTLSNARPVRIRRQAAEQHGLVAEARDEHAGRHVEQQHADAAQADDERGERRARADVEHVERQQDRQRFLAHGHQQRRHVDRQQQPIVRRGTSRSAAPPTVPRDQCTITCGERYCLTAVIGDGLPLRSRLPFSVPSAASSAT